jgi:hypothetical protein
MCQLQDKDKQEVPGRKWLILSECAQLPDLQQKDGVYHHREAGLHW